MAYIKYNRSKLYNGCPKGLKVFMALGLSLVLQSRACHSLADQTVKSNPVAFRQHIDNLKDISAKQDGKRDQLYAAVDQGNLEAVKAILQRINEDKSKAAWRYRTADFPNHVDQKGQKTPLGCAIFNKNVPILKLLLENEHIDINKVDATNRTAFVLALNQRSRTIAKLLLQNNRSQKLDLTAKDPKSGDAPLHIAIKNNLIAIAKLFMPRLGKDTLCAKGKKNKTPLHLAAYYGQIGFFKEMFLHLAADNKKEAVDQLFIKDGKDCSVFAAAYLGKGPIIYFKSNYVADFKSVLSLVSDSLAESQWEDVVNEINDLYVKGKKYQYINVKQLQDVVASMRPKRSHEASQVRPVHPKVKKD